MLNSDENKKLIIAKFPNLVGDASFKVIDKSSPDYNCFAWAANHSDIFWTPLPRDKRPFHDFDGVSYNWPFDAAEDTKLTTMIGLFSKLGYKVCDNGSIEEGYRKVALYGTNDEITHASRQFVTGNDRGKWSSKLGQWFLIRHGAPSTIEGKEYGDVITYLRMPFPD